MCLSIGQEKFFESNWEEFCIAVRMHKACGFKNGIGLGHNRLSIIDLSEEANQPMIDAETGNVIVFNGEIYNYQEIRAELALKGVRFKTQSDTEVILKSYALKGHACVEDFVGMWAMAIWDPSKQELFCSRDRFGIKPFYYSRSGPGFYFGSEYKVFSISTFSAQC